MAINKKSSVPAPATDVATLKARYGPMGLSIIRSRPRGRVFAFSGPRTPDLYIALDAATPAELDRMLTEKLPAQVQEQPEEQQP